MKGGRKNLKRATKEHYLTLEDGQSIAQVVSLRGSNLIEVMDSRGEKSLALFPAKFHKSMWMKRGSFVVVNESGKEKALESGSKVGSIVSQVLFYEQCVLCCCAMLIGYRTFWHLSASLISLKVSSRQLRMILMGVYRRASRRKKLIMNLIQVMKMAFPR
ncbi:uncharacterized protein [Euphorbia lathyris]|uniref:uncharacterized protein isoform X2 n=1 Tax=Euphorbia lathyris TaxID=212925 RepID=UPI00331310FA